MANLILKTQRSEPVDDRVWYVRFSRSPPSVNNTWKRAEYDREQEAILEDHESRRSLGVYGDWAPWHRGSGEDWYGGRISQRARIIEENGRLKVYLDAPFYHENTSRFARFLGSRRMICLSIPPGLNKDRLRDFLAQKFVICGRVFVPLRPKDAKSGKSWKVYLIEVNEDVERSPKASEGDRHRLTLQGFVRWHNPIELNNNQVCHTAFYGVHPTEVVLPAHLQVDNQIRFGTLTLYPRRGI